MYGVSTERAPGINLIVPHFVFAGFSFFILSILIFFSADSLTGHFFQTRLFAITHTVALAWGTMVIFGALYQLIPVVFETALYSEKIARVNFWLFVVSIILLVYSFWSNNLMILLQISASVLLISISLFALNIFLSVKEAEKKNYSSKFVKAAVTWLMITAIFGTLLAFNFQYDFLNETGFNYLKIHVHAGVIGWFLLLIMGAAATLIPMFLVSHNLDEKRLRNAYYLINTGLIFLIGSWIFEINRIFQFISWGIITSGILFYISFVYDSYKKKLRKLDIGMRHTFVAFIVVFLPVILGFIAILQQNSSVSIIKNVIILYGFTIFFGFISTLILGQTYKTLPFIVWLDRYKSWVGKTKTPVPRELYSEKLADFQLYFYTLTILLFIFGITFSNIIVIKIAAVILLMTAILYNINILKIVLHKRKENLQ